MLTGIATPEILTRSLETQFMVGFIGANNTSVPFFVLNVSGHDTGLIGMYEWEQKMPKFFDAVFGMTMGTQMQSATKFRDIVVLGRDARVLELSPDTGIAYMFANPQTIIVTTNKKVLQELVTRVTNK